MGIFTGSIDVGRVQDILATTVFPKLGSGIVLTKDYVMDLSSRFINFKIAMSSITVFMGALLFISGFSIIYKSIKSYIKWNKNNTTYYHDWFDDEPVEILKIILGVCIIIVSITILANIVNLIQRIYIPEIPLFKELISIKSAI